MMSQTHLAALAAAFVLNPVLFAADDAAAEHAQWIKQKTDALVSINAILVDIAEPAQVDARKGDLQEAAESHHEALVQMHRARSRDYEAWIKAWLEHRESHDEAHLAFNDHLERLTPEGRRLPPRELIELSLEMFGKASGIYYVRRDFWLDASIRTSGTTHQVDDGENLVIGIEDGMTRGLRSTMHPIRTAAYITLDRDVALNEWIDLDLGETLHVNHFSGYSPGHLDPENLEKARVRIIKRDEERIVLEAELLGEIMDMHDPERRKTHLDFRGRFTVRIAEKPCR